MTDARLQVEHLPATGPARQQLVLLHGWASNREVWRPLLARLRCWADITLLELPGVAPAAGDDSLDLSGVLEKMAALLPATAVFLGWSLGASLGVEFARRYPTRVSALVCLAYNPCFVARGGWPGMAPEDFQQFQQSLAEEPRSLLRRFDSLQSAGAGDPRALQRCLRPQRRDLQPLALASTLGWLQSDQRRVLAALTMPQLHLYARDDQLVPVAAAGAVAALPLPDAESGQLPGSHLLPLESAAELAQRLQRFLQARQLLADAVDEAEPPLDKRAVAASFSRAARDYDRVAALQRDVGERLVAALETLQREPATVLDLGSGTGHFYPALQARFPDAHYIGLDLAQGMVEFARERHSGAGDWLVGDAESLPLASGSVDLVFSSLAFQWCYRPEQLFAELARVLRPGGLCLFSSLGPATLQELRRSWQAVDRHRHVNSFLPAARLEAAARGEAGLGLSLSREQICLRYPRVQDLLRELKTLGAHNMNHDRPAGLTGRGSLRGMLQAYEAWRCDGLVPATYEVLYGTLERA